MAHRVKPERKFFLKNAEGRAVKKEKKKKEKKKKNEEGHVHNRTHSSRRECQHVNPLNTFSTQECRLKWSREEEVTPLHRARTVVAVCSARLPLKHTRCVDTCVVSNPSLKN